MDGDKLTDPEEIARVFWETQMLFGEIMDKQEAEFWRERLVEGNLEAEFDKPYSWEPTPFGPAVARQVADEASVYAGDVYYYNCQVDESWTKEALVDLVKVLMVIVRLKDA